MVKRAILRPSANHPITITRNPNRVVVRVGHNVVADTREGLTLREANYPAVQYIPRKDIDLSLLSKSDHTTYCPYKGDAGYFNLTLKTEKGSNAVWTYETPFGAVAAIAGHLAFYSDRVDIQELPMSEAAWHDMA